MTYKYSNEEGVKLSKELGDKAIELARQAEVAARQYEANMQLFTVHSAQDNEELMETARMTMHECVDIICDAQVSLERIRKEQIDILRATNPFATRW